MAYPAHVLRVMIASPSDTAEARDAVETAIYGWNQSNAHNKKIILQPWRWETSSVPELGGHPQSLINSQGVDQSDIVFALFAGRLGSPTPGAVSGTVEEIERAVEQGKPVHLYFSTSPLPHDIDTSQLEGLREFKKQIGERGLLGEYGNISELTHKVWQAIEHDIASVVMDGSVLEQNLGGVKFAVQPKQERELKGTNNRGKPTYTTRRWVEVTNKGGKDAEQVLFKAADNSSFIIHTRDEPTVIHAGQTRNINLTYMMGGDSEILRIIWTEDGEQKEQEFHIG